MKEIGWEFTLQGGLTMEESVLEFIVLEVMQRLKKKETMYILPFESYEEDLKATLEKRYRVENLTCHASLTRSSKLFLPGLRPSQLMALWQGIAVDPLTEYGIYALFYGAPLYVCARDVSLPKELKTPYQKRYHEALAFLKASGLVLWDSILEEKPKGATSFLWEERLLAENHVVALIEKGMETLQMKRGTLITPAAKDQLREHHIEVSEV